uniref:ATP synthase F0 subunit 8 n=1 Tax=Urochela quadrinotata TaxID=1176167 RepID=L7P031_UROQU|nr:ATP synthase F0 subunit 8 [Urochela quadrinotata]AFI54776.1 ATP synthase F0 subunit 8 [Urochela quadrinotata]
MPQMSPMWWEIMMLIFIFMMMIFSIGVFHNKFNNTKTNSYMLLKKNMNWMW